MTLFLLQIVEANPPHVVVRLPGGGALERELIASVTDASRAKIDELTEAFVGDVIARGVGFGRTEAHVEADLRASLATYVGLLGDAIRSGVTETISDLKRESRLATGIA